MRAREYGGRFMERSQDMCSRLAMALEGIGNVTDEEKEHAQIGDNHCITEQRAICSHTKITETNRN